MLVIAGAEYHPRLEFSGSVRGRKESPLFATFDRDLTEDDLATFRSAPRATTQPPAIKHLRASHHNLAQKLASGLSNSEASLATGYSMSRISILLKDPTFKNSLFTTKALPLKPSLMSSNA